MPYFCLRVPTCGGKTRLAARAVELVNSKLLRSEHSVIWETSKELIEQAGVASRTKAVTVFQSPSERGLDFRVPQLAVMVHGELVMFDDPELLDYPWDLGLAYRPEHWTEARLAAWICRNLPDPYTTHAGNNAFVSAWLGTLLQHDGHDLGRANRQQFLIRQLIEAKSRTCAKPRSGKPINKRGSATTAPRASRWTEAIVSSSIRTPRRRTGIPTDVSAKRISNTTTTRESATSTRRRNPCAPASWKNGRRTGASTSG